MNPYQRYIKLKALADYYESLSDDDKKLLTQSLSENENNIERKLDVIEQKVEKNHHSFGFGVLENVVGNGAYDLGLWLLKRLIPR